jgi:dual specificity tyrosine-phosphorylation-regulated kinase 2/3/4
VFKKHICIITELLSMSLYELLETNNFASLDMTYIRTFAIQILNALAYLKEIKVVHSDLKPENVMLKNKLKTGIKIIDFGTSMFSN